MSTVEKLFSELTEWDGNPRPPASYEERSEMRASLAHTGQVTAMIGREVDGKVEVVAGRNRLRSIGELIEEGVWNEDRPLLVHLREMSDVEALEIATSENINIPMHPMHQFEAFQRMVEMGKDPTVIANTFGVTERIVRQRLSYAKLDERARMLVKNDERSLDWASVMTLASPSEQSAILDEIENDPRRFRNAAEVRSRLQDDLVPLRFALFDQAKADDKLVRKDLFDPNDETYMLRSDFIPLQDEALKEMVQADKDAGWKDVQVMSEKEFDIYKYVDGITNPEEGVVIYVRHYNGEIVRYEGMALRFEEKIKQISSEDEEAAASIFGEDGNDDGIDGDTIRAFIAEEDDEEVYVESSKAEKHLTKERAAIAQKMLLENGKLTLAVTVAGLLGRSAARPVEGKIFSELSELDTKSIARQAITERSDLCHDIMTKAGINALMDYKELVKGLYNLTDGDLNLIYQSEIAKRVRSDLNQIENLTEVLLEVTETNISDHWQMDQTFLQTLSVKSLRGLAADILPPRLLGRLGKSKNDMIETLCDIAEDARSEGGRLDSTERKAFLEWTPKALGGQQFDNLEDIFAEDIQEVVDSEIESLFSEDEESEDNLAE